MIWVKMYLVIFICGFMTNRKFLFIVIFHV